MEYSRLPDLDGLATLKAVVEGGGVAVAAQLLHIGQPAVTKRLRALEDCYEYPIMQRIGGRLHLTEARKKVYQMATLFLDRHLALLEELRMLNQGSENLRLEVTFAIGEHLLPELLIQFGEENPSYMIESRLGYSRQIFKHLAAGNVDMALLETAPEHPDILVQKWQDDELWLVCDKIHPMVNQGPISMQQMTGLQFVLREARSSVRTALDNALREVNAPKLKISFEVGSSEAIIDMLEHGRHVSFLPRFSVEERVADGSLYHIPVTGFKVTRSLWIARSRTALGHPVAEAFIKLIQSWKKSA